MENVYFSVVIGGLIIGIISYLIGSVNFSIILSRAISGKDIRESGSGNAGATNMLRTHGKKMGVITLLLDVVKGVVCVLIAVLFEKYLISSAQAQGNYEAVSALTAAALPYIAGVCVILGHNFPLYFKFKGGKGVATSLGVVLVLDWKVGLIVGLCAIAVMAATRYVSLGSVLGGGAYIVVEAVKMFVTHDVIVVRLICVIIMGGLLIGRHHANIKRLLNGTENKLGGKK